MIPSKPARRGYAVPLHENNPSVPRSDALPYGGRRCRLKFQPDAAPKKRLSRRSTPSLAAHRDAIPLFYHKLLLRAADQSRNQIINTRMPINSGRQFVRTRRGGKKRVQFILQLIDLNCPKTPLQVRHSYSITFNYIDLILILNFFLFVICSEYTINEEFSTFINVVSLEDYVKSIQL